jgi:hypothetical protein
VRGEGLSIIKAVVNNQDSDSRIQIPESRFQNPDSRFQNPDSRIQIPDSDSRIQIPDSRFQIPESRFQIPDSRVRFQLLVLPKLLVTCHARKGASNCQLTEHI